MGLLQLYFIDKGNHLFEKENVVCFQEGSLLVIFALSALNLKVSSFFTRLLSYNFVVSATVVQIQSISDLYL